MARRDELIAFLDGLLDSPGRADYGPNGLQVPGAEEVDLVVTGVSAHRELFERAAAAGAQLVLCHHGIFWGDTLGPVTEQLKARLKLLFGNDMSLAAYHLPLDAHPEIGNNALIRDGLGFDPSPEPFGLARDRPIGVVGRSAEGVGADGLVERVRTLTERDPLVFAAGPDPVHSIGIASGAGASMVHEAVSLGLDVLLTGEPAEHVMADAREGGLHFIAAGHYATETFGVRRLGELVAERFDVAHEFIAVPNPV